MMRTCIFYAVLCLSSRVSAQDSYVKFLPEKPHAGDTVTVVYDAGASRAVFHNADELISDVYLRTYPKAIRLSLPMLRNGNKWSVQIPTLYPDTTQHGGKKIIQYLLLQFRSHDLTDLNRGRGWYCIFYNDHDSAYAGTYTNIALMSFLPGSAPFEITKDLAVADSLIHLQIALYPDFDYARIASWRIRLERDSSQLVKDAIISEINKLYDKVKDSIAQSYEFLQWLKWAGRTTEAEELEAQTLRKAPSGSLAQSLALMKQNPNIQFSVAPPSLNPVACGSGIVSDTISRLRALIDKGDLDAAIGLYDSMRNPQLGISLGNACIMQDKYREKGIRIALACLELYFIKDAQGNWSPKKPWPGIVGYMSDELSTIDLYAGGLMRAKRYAEVIDFCRGLYRTLHGECLMSNSVLVKALYRTENYEEMMRFGWECFEHLVAGDEMLEYMRTVALMSGGALTGFEDTLAALRAKIRPRIQQMVRSKRIDASVEDGPLHILDGETVKLSELAGNVVVLEFWSSWSDVAIKSFPKLEAACARFSKNPRVKLFAVNANERVDAHEREAMARREALRMKCAIPFVIDTYFSHAYKMNGMPETFVIGKNGRIQFREGPYINKIVSEEELATEIELLLAE